MGCFHRGRDVAVSAREIAGTHAAAHTSARRLPDEAGAGFAQSASVSTAAARPTGASAGASHPAITSRRAQAAMGTNTAL